MKTKLQIKTLKTHKQYRELNAILHKELYNELDIVPKRLGFLSMGVSEISGIVGATAAVVTLIYMVYKDKKGEQIQWNLEKLKCIVETECARLGLLNIEIIEIVNFDALLEEKYTTCVVKIKTKDGKLYIINVTRKGDAIIIR